MTPRPIAFTGLVLSGVAVLLTCHVAMGAASIGRASEKSADVCRQIDNRVDHAAQVDGPQVFLVGGSGVRAGLSAEYLSDAIGVEAMNFGFLAALGPELNLAIAKRAAEPGDTVIMFLEYPQLATSAWNDISLDIGLTCMVDTVLDMGPRPIAEALVAAGPKRLWTVLSEQGDIDSVEKRPLNEHADRRLDSFRPLSAEAERRVDLYGPVRVGALEGSWADTAIREFAAWADDAGVAVYASWPNTIDQPEYANDPGFTQVREFYEDRGITFVDTPERGLYPREMFYDTQYHMDYDAIRVRTQDFVDEIQRAGIDLASR